MELLSLRSERAVTAAARELGVDPLALANALQDGRLAQLVLELRLAERRASGASRDRLIRLLDSLPARAENENG
jgi:hypothetical protein